MPAACAAAARSSPDFDLDCPVFQRLAQRASIGSAASVASSATSIAPMDRRSRTWAGTCRRSGGRASPRARSAAARPRGRAGRTERRTAGRAGTRCAAGSPRSGGSGKFEMTPSSAFCALNIASQIAQCISGASAGCAALVLVALERRRAQDTGSDSTSPSRAESFSLRLSAPPSTPIDTSARKANAAEKRVSCW